MGSAILFSIGTVKVPRVSVIFFLYLTGLTSFYTELMRALGASSRIWELSDRTPLIPYKGNELLNPLDSTSQLHV